MNNRQKQLVKYTQKLQTQISLPLWSIANESIINAASQNDTAACEKNGGKMRRLISFSRKIKHSDTMIFIVGFIKVFLLWKNIKSKALFKKQTDTRFKKVFAGFGASSEEHFFQELKQQSNEDLLYINWVNFTGMNQLDCPTLFQIIFELYKNAFGHTKKFKTAPPEIKAYEMDFLTVCARNIGLYSFFCIYWKKAKLCGVEEVIFLAPDMPAYACIEAKIKTTFTQHGLFAFDILIPRLQRINTLTSIEENYFRSLFANIEIVKIHKNIHISEHKNNTIMILSPNTFLQERLQIIKPFIYWCKNFNMKIIIRPTNKVTPNELSLLQSEFPSCTLDNINLSIHQSLESAQPKFVAAWTSTALIIALEYGFLPISFCDPSEEHLQRIIYPFSDRVLFWSRDKKCIEQACNSSDFYAKQVSQLQNTPMNFTD